MCLCAAGCQRENNLLKGACGIGADEDDPSLSFGGKQAWQVLTSLIMLPLFEKKQIIHIPKYKQ